MKKKISSSLVIFGLENNKTIKGRKKKKANNREKTTQTL